MERYTPEMAIRDVKAQRKRILRVLRPFVRDAERGASTYGLIVVDAKSVNAAAKLYKDLGGK